MFDITENDFQVIDAATRKTYGKPFSETTIGEIQRMTLALTPAHIGNPVAAVDQINAALRDTEECNCPIRVPHTEAGEMDLAGARPLHTCGVPA